MPGANGDRAAELAERLRALRARIAAACAQAGRLADDVTLVAVTKNFPASDVALLAALGVTDVGENRDQEAAPKAAECAARGLALRWHFVGQLQVNKCASVVSYADVVHSVDRLRLVRALGTRARAAGRVVTCLIQVRLDEAAEPAGGHDGQRGHDARPGERGGALPADVPGLADAIAAEDGLVLGGVMAVAPLWAAPRPAFRRLREVAELVRSEHPGASTISAGMSGDLEDAIAEGATHLRVGTALLGGRQAFVR
ncbi:MAG TPA: YggS family pyridoxal phosphate enzyme [Streptosporangiaceae bacterium]|nr:YggS family pyridoxal phosphate enzyme [Streptosporangiaceae bacterium]